MSPLERWISMRDVIGIPPSAKLVLYALCSRADERDRCHPGYKTIAEDTGLSRRTVGSAIKTLAKAKLLAYIQGRPNQYSLYLPVTRSVQSLHRQSATIALEVVQEVVPTKPRKPRQLQEACVVCHKRLAVLDRKCSHCINRHAAQALARITCHA